MRTRPASRALAASTCWLAACASVDRDESDRSAFFGDVRVRKALDAKAEHDGSFLEVGGELADGDAGGIDYSITTVEIGAAFDVPVAESGWAGAFGGIGWLHTELDSASGFDDEDAIGPYGGGQAGWFLSPAIVLYARAQIGLYLKDFSNVVGVQGGVRVHAFERASLFLGWRGSRYNLQDLDTLTSIDLLQLDASGPVLGLELSF